jgi:hypothetical protein
MSQDPDPFGAAEEFLAIAGATALFTDVGRLVDQHHVGPRVLFQGFLPLAQLFTHENVHWSISIKYERGCHQSVLIA